jgi:hypothetical protein
MLSTSVSRSPDHAQGLDLLGEAHAGHVPVVLQRAQDVRRLGGELGLQVLHGGPVGGLAIGRVLAGHLQAALGLRQRRLGGLLLGPDGRNAGLPVGLLGGVQGLGRHALGLAALGDEGAQPVKLGGLGLQRGQRRQPHPRHPGVFYAQWA